LLAKYNVPVFGPKRESIPGITRKLGQDDEIEVPGVTDSNAYALEITGDSMMPVYREGDTIVISPAATIRKGDRVVVRTTDGQVMAKIMQRQTSKTIELASFNADHPPKLLDMKDVDWVARIVWASQ